MRAEREPAFPPHRAFRRTHPKLNAALLTHLLVIPLTADAEELAVLQWMSKLTTSLSGVRSMFSGLLGNCTVSDLQRAESWYTQLFARDPDRRPMDGLLEWHLGPGFGIQVWCEPQRSGHSTVVLEVSDLPEQAQRLVQLGIEHQGLQPGGGAQILQLVDPDGNRVVLSSVVA